MKAQIFCILDMVAERYLDPFFTVNTATAIRSFERACRDPEGFGKNLEDYALYHIGEWDAELAVIEPMPASKVATGITFANQGPQLEVDRVHEEGRA